MLPLYIANVSLFVIIIEEILFESYYVKRGSVSSYTFLLLISLIVYSLLTLQPSLWIDLRRFHDNPIIYIAVAIGSIIVLAWIRKLTEKSCFYLLFFSSCFEPIFAPLASILYAGICNDTNFISKPIPKKTINRASIVFIVGLFFYVLPRLTIYILDYRSLGSSFLYRSGLDGANDYFNFTIEAFTHPFNSLLNRSSSPWPTILLVFSTLFTLKSIDSESLSYSRLIRMILLAICPYLYFLAIFPQWVAIHPYVFDFLLHFPLSVCSILGILYIFNKPLTKKVEIIILSLTIWLTLQDRFIALIRYFK